MPPAPTVSPALQAFASAVVGGILLSWSWAIVRIGSGRALLPRAETRPVPWGSVGLGVVVLIWLALNAVVGAAASLLAIPRGPDLRPADQMLMVSAINLGMVLLVPRALTLTSGARPEDLGLGRGPVAANLARGAVGCLLMLPGVYAVHALALRVWPARHHELEKLIRSDPSAVTFLLALVTAVILAPAAEELIFRGVLQPWLAKFLAQTARRLRRGASGPAGGDEPIGGPGSVGAVGPQRPDLPRTVHILEPWALAPGSEASVSPAVFSTPTSQTPQGSSSEAEDSPSVDSPIFQEPHPGLPVWARSAAIVVISALFAGIHLPQWPAPLGLFVLALALGVLYDRTGRLLAPMALHACFNGISTLALFLSASGPAAPELAPGPAVTMGGRIHNFRGDWDWQNRPESGRISHSHHLSPASVGWPRDRGSTSADRRPPRPDRAG